ncbi:MAG: hypothetical protein JW966_08705 [Anaerolineae bacterium]|nr:hypothetical protein [Anaerolineae bacterium]
MRNAAVFRQIGWPVVFGIVLVVSLGACGEPDSTPAPPTAPAITRTPAPVTVLSNKLGVHLLLDDGRHHWPLDRWPDHMRWARDTVGEWGIVVQVIRSDDLDPVRWQVFMDLCADLHLVPMLRLATVFDRDANWWTAPPADEDGSYRALAARYTAFVTGLDWPVPEHLVIVGNEPNHGSEWGGDPDPAAYARLLIDVADALHAADPGARVLNAGLDPFAPHTGGQAFLGGPPLIDSVSFLDAMVAAYPDVLARLDAWASHSYPLGPFAEGPWQQAFAVDRLDGAPGVDSLPVTPPPGIMNRGINAYAWELVQLAALGAPALPVIITETGWRHAETVDPAALDRAPDGDAPDGAPWPDAATVADYVDLALRGNGERNVRRYPDLPQDGWTPWLDDPRVVGVAFFAFDGLPAEWAHTNWLILDADGVVRGSYPVVERLKTISAGF